MGEPGKWRRAAVAVSALLLLAATRQGIDPWAEPLEKIYWGDLHVHTSYSVDAFISGMAPGRYVDEAGQYAYYCAKLDFYAVTDHSEMLTDTNYWQEAIRAAQHFNRLGRENPGPEGDPSLVVFPGWEWTLSYLYGHKNVILKYDDPAKLPPAPIRNRPGVQGFPPRIQRMELNAEEMEGVLNPKVIRAVLGGFPYGMRHGKQNQEFVAPTSGDLFRLLRKFCVDAGTGCEAQVIPHGNAWGIAPVMITYWDKQLDPANHDPELQRIIEVYSKHGNSEEYSYFPPYWKYLKNGVEVPEDECFVEVEPGALNKFINRTIGGAPAREMLPECEKVCPEPTAAMTPCCWRAGEIVAERCLDPDSEWCKEQIELARKAVKPFPKPLTLRERRNLKPEFRRHPGQTEAVDWKDCNQCRDCWQPAVNYRARGSVQAGLASGWFDENGKPLHYRFGFIASTDSHSAWAGSVKETKRMIEPNTGLVAYTNNLLSNDYPGWERVDNFLNPGGLAAILAPRRTRDDLWESLESRNVYGTSGARIELWARAVIEDKVVRMGSETISAHNPTFYIKANGAFKEEDTCPYEDEPVIKAHLTREQFEEVCGNQCYRPADERAKIARIEVVKVLQPLNKEEAAMANLERSPENPNGLIMDPYHVAEFHSAQVEWSWTDPEFVKEPKGRSVAYYFRVIQEPTPGYNCRPIALLQQKKTCDLQEPKDSDIEKRINPQDGSEPESLLEIEDPCYTDPEEPESYCQERAWSSPFYVIRK